jgi:esterase/lipase
MRLSLYVELILLVLLLTSCSFDNQFLKPTKISIETKSVRLKNRPAETTISFSGENKQPMIMSKEMNPDSLEYNIESVFFQSTSGNMLNGWMITPTGSESDLILLSFHGNAGCLPTVYEQMIPLVKAGFQVFMFDYSGFGFSAGKSTRASVYKDGLAALDYLLSRDDVRGKILVVYGQSYGGYLAGVIGSQRQNDIDGLVLEGAFSSHQDIACDSVGFWGKILVRAEYSAAESVRDFHKPILIIHSREDEVVPFKFGKKIYDNANQPKELFEIDYPHLHGTAYYSDIIISKINGMFR